MIEVGKATALILETVFNVGTETIPFHLGNGRVLKSDLVADRDFPPYHRVTMDGIAIKGQSFLDGQRDFPIQAMQTAGAPQMTLNDPAYCIEVMTGAVLPEGTDTVIRYEDLKIEGGKAAIQVSALKVGQNVHQQGIDKSKGSVLMTPNTVLTASELAAAATIGASDLSVAKLPKIAIIATGDELVDVHETPLPHQIRMSNVHQIRAGLEKWRINADIIHIKDDQAATVARLGTAVDSYDVLILSGGVSKGKKDFVPNALEEIGVEKLFHRVAQRPGKPFWFGHIPGRTMVFALPGNPVSSFMCLNRYVMPWLRASFGLKPFESLYAILESDVSFKPDLTYFLQVKVYTNPEGQLMAKPIHGHGSGDHASLISANAFIELARGPMIYEAGNIYPIHFFKSLH